MCSFFTTFVSIPDLLFTFVLVWFLHNKKIHYLFLKPGKEATYVRHTNKNVSTLLPVSKLNQKHISLSKPSKNLPQKHPKLSPLAQPRAQFPGSLETSLWRPTYRTKLQTWEQRKKAGNVDRDIRDIK